MSANETAKKEDDQQKEIASYEIERSLLTDAYFQLKETTNALEKSEKVSREAADKFSAAFNSSLDLMAITRVSDGKLLEVNEAYSRVLGHSHAESVGKTTTELSIWADAADRVKFVAALEKDGQVLNFETVLRRKDGTLITVIDAARTFDLQGERCILSTVHDITARKRAEVELVHMNRALRMLSTVNQALIYTADEASLLKEVCRVIDEMGGYRMLWIGYKEENAEKTVRPVSSEGFDSGYLESAHITWADTEYGRGPVGVALRTGQMQIVRDISKESHMAPWHKLARERGYQSLIVLPLKRDTETFGILSIYADKPDAFSPEEVKILEELANDLTFGIVSLRTSSERKLLEDELLKASADRYKALFVSSRDAIMTLEPPEWKFTSGNPATVKMFGVKSEGDFLFHEPWTLSPEFQPDGRNSMEKAKEMIDEAMREGSNFFEWTHRRANGEDFPAEVFLSQVEQDGKIYLHALIRDVTERKKLEEKLKEYAEEKFKVIFDNTNDGMVLADVATKKFSLANAAFCKMLGYSPEEVQKLGIPDIHPAEHLPYVLEQFDRQGRGDLTIAKDIPVKKKDGSVFYADVNASPITLDGKKFLLGIFRDTTGRKEVEQKEKEYVEGVESMNKLMIGRELKMIELKGEIEELRRKLAAN